MKIKDRIQTIGIIIISLFIAIIIASSKLANYYFLLTNPLKYLLVKILRNICLIAVIILIIYNIYCIVCYDEEKEIKLNEIKRKSIGLVNYFLKNFSKYIELKDLIKEENAEEDLLNYYNDFLKDFVKTYNKNKNELENDIKYYNTYVNENKKLNSSKLVSTYFDVLLQGIEQDVLKYEDFIDKKYYSNEIICENFDNMIYYNKANKEAITFKQLFIEKINKIKSDI